MDSRNLLPEFREFWSRGPVIPCGDMHQSFTDTLVKCFFRQLPLSWLLVRSNGQAIIFHSCGFFFLWPPNRAGHYILQLWFCMAAQWVRSLYFAAVVSFFFFPRLFSTVRDRMSTIGLFPHMCGISANLECMSEMCCTRLAENTGSINYAKNRHLYCGDMHQSFTKICQAISSQLRHVSTIGKKLLNSDISSTCLHNMVNFGSLTAEIVWRVWGTPASFNGFCVLASLLHRRRSTEVNQTLHDVWSSPELVHYMYIFRSSCPLT